MEWVGMTDQETQAELDDLKARHRSSRERVERLLAEAEATLKADKALLNPVNSDQPLPHGPRFVGPFHRF